jgi:hypothetical protein
MSKNLPSLGAAGCLWQGDHLGRRFMATLPARVDTNILLVSRRVQNARQSPSVAWKQTTLDT